MCLRFFLKHNDKDVHQKCYFQKDFDEQRNCFLHLHYTLTLDTYTRHLHHTLTLDTYTVHLHYTLSLDTYTRHLHYTLTLYTHITHYTHQVTF